MSDKVFDTLIALSLYISERIVAYSTGKEEPPTLDEYKRLAEQFKTSQPLPTQIDVGFLDEIKNKINQFIGNEQ